MDRAQRLDEKNGVICLVIMFTSRVIVIKMSKMDHFLYFLLMTATVSYSLGKYWSAAETSYWVSSENGKFNRLWSYRLWNNEGRNIIKTAESVKNTETLYFQGLQSY